MADATGLDLFIVRLLFLVLAFAGGVGVIVYLLAWAVLPEGPGQPRAPRHASPQQVIAANLIVLGILLLLRRLGLWFGDGLVWPVVLAAAGSQVIWSRGDADERRRWTRLTTHLPGGPLEAVFEGRISPPRLLGGAALIALGMVAFLAANDALAAARDVALAMAVTLAGALLILGPWLNRLVRQLTNERRDRIRSEERAEVAAHLHDSVLQTLALIQRNADHPRTMVSLARRQERELRSWLYGPRADPAGPGTIGAALDALVEEVEDAHEVEVEVVVVGDRPLDPPARALLAAIREAVVNAAHHAGTPVVRVYLEASATEISAYVRDRGRGFDPDQVPDDRRGVADSIRGRLRRHGGTVTIDSTIGVGTEVALALPRNADDHPAEPS